MRRASSGALILTSAAGVAGGIGAINPTSGRCLPDFMGQWQITGLPACEWEPCGRQHIMGADDASQAMPQAIGASGTVRRAAIARMAWMRRISESLAQRTARRPLGHAWACRLKVPGARIKRLKTYHRGHRGGTESTEKA